MLGIFGLGALGVALLLNLGISVTLAARGDRPVYPAVPDRIFLLVALWGFAVPMAWGYSTRFVTGFLGLRPPLHSAAYWFCAGIAALVVSSLFQWFALADVLALALTLAAIWAIRLFHPPARRPKTIGVYRYYPTFVRLAYVWLIVGAILGLYADLAPAQVGLGGASRHAATVGFLATLIFAIGPRILPSFLNGRELYSSRLMALSLWSLNLGCMLRVSSESVAYSAGHHSAAEIAWILLPVSAFLELAAVSLFVVNVGMTLIQPLPAWFTAEAINANLPLYWYVSSFPKTKRLLVGAGLKTLTLVHEPPRSLSLADAARADGVEIEPVLAHLRSFFSQRQPRRAGRG